MATCVAEKTSTQLPPIIYPRKSFQSTTYDERKTSMSCRKRLLSEQNDLHISSMEYFDDDEDEIPKRTKTDLFDRESMYTNTRHGMQYFALSFFERTRHCHSAPQILLRRKSVSQLTYIKDVAPSQTTITFFPTLPKTSKKNMLLCQQHSTIVINNETDKDFESIFLTCSELAAFIVNVNQTKLIIDCGSPLRHTERRIQDSFLLNVNDKISRKRLTTRGLKNFLDTNQLNRLDKNQFIILYDDTTRASSCCDVSIQSQLSPAMKCIYDEIKRYDETKKIYILQSSFNDFYQHYSSFCYVSTSNNEEDFPLPTPTPMKQYDIDFCPLSEVLSGLYLGSSRDAEDLNLLKQTEIKSIINVSTTIPCYFQNENIFEYFQLPCHDSLNQNILQYFEETFQYIHQQLSMNRNVLVHCQGGVSRSPSFIIGYLMKYHLKTFDEAYNLVKSKRNIINPNLNFLGQLTQYQHMLS